MTEQNRDPFILLCRQLAKIESMVCMPSEQMNVKALPTVISDTMNRIRNLKWNMRSFQK